jgi:2-keto-4-pentenoate hydratase
MTMSDIDPRRTIAIRAAERLITAARTGVATEPVRDILGDSDIALAYDVQAILTRHRLAEGQVRVGRKIGLTSPAVQQQLGVTTPDTGVLFDDMEIPDGGVIAAGRLIAPRVEAEVAFVLAADLPDFGADAPLDQPITDAEREQAAAAVDHAVAALEIVDSRVAAWDIRITDTVADNASSGCYVLGRERRTLAEVAPIDVTMTVFRNGEAASSGDGAACLGDPLVALAWLARTAARFGLPLQRGELILSGAMGPLVSALPGDHIHVQTSALGSVSVTFAPGPEGD